MRVTVSEYDPQWALDFQAIKAELETALHGIDYVSIEHVGSTSVPLLPAKPIIDIDIIITCENLPQTTEALTQKAGYKYVGEWGITDRHAFRKADSHPPRNLYVCIEGCPALQSHLAVRGVCLKNAEVRQEYGRVKMELADREWKNVDEYCEAKDEILAYVLMQAGLTEGQMLDIRNTNTNATFRHQTYPEVAKKPRPE